MVIIYTFSAKLRCLLKRTALAIGTGPQPFSFNIVYKKETVAVIAEAAEIMKASDYCNFSKNIWDQLKRGENVHCAESQQSSNDWKHGVYL